MKTRQSAAMLVRLPLDPQSLMPFYRQLFEQIRASILNGQLAAGTRLPSTRALAVALGLSRNTVSLAYDQLLAEGYVEGKTGAGTFVSRDLPEQYFDIPIPSAAVLHQKVRTPSALSQRGRAFISGPDTLAQKARSPRPFERVFTALDAFPKKTWARIVARRWRNASIELMSGYGHPAGYQSLQEAIAEYLAATRAVQCTPEQIVVIPGWLDLPVRLLIDPGDSVWIEEPTYPAFRRTLLAAGATLVPVPVDDEGLNVSAGIASCPTARLAYVTPSCQYPLGMTMSLPRRMALLEWASRIGAWIIEDDYGSEHRYHGRPLASLQGLDRDGRVIYLGSFSRVLFPAISLCYAVLPHGLIDACIAARAAVEGPQRLFEQSVVADFIAEGHFARHLRRMRNVYAERQEVLLRVAARGLDGLLDLRPAEGGTFLVGRLPHGVNDLEASRVALQLGIVADPLSPLYLTRPQQGGLLLGYTSISAARIGEGVRKLAEALNAGCIARK